MDAMSRERWLRLAIAVGFAVLLVTAVRSFVKHATYPIPAIEVGPPPAGFEEVFWDGGGVRVHGWHGGTDDPSRPVVVFFHGNGENLETLKWSGLLERWRELGVYAVAVEYPGYGRSAGSPSEAGLIDAGLAALDWATERWPERPVTVAGWSLGSAVAIQVAAQRSGAVDGLILMSAWTRLFDAAAAHFPSLLVRVLVRESYDSLTAAGRIGCPTLVVHGLRDRIIPAAQGERLAEALGARGRWVPVDEAGHNDLLGVGRVWTELGAFVDERAGG